MDFAAAFTCVSSSIVNVLAIESPGKAIASCTGSIIGNGDQVLTCAHCVVNKTTPAARFAGQTTYTPATVEHIDHDADLAILKFEDPIGSAVTLRSSTTLLIGHEAFVVGFPSKIEKLTLLSAHIAGFEPNAGFDLIRIDSSINHGNSGGPLFNSSGELVGVVSAKHGSLSNFLREVQNAKPSVSMSIGGLDPLKVIRQLIREMSENLNLGIGYAVPIDRVGSLWSTFQSAILS